jgi:glucose/arabinose dehydrogenase
MFPDYNGRAFIAQHGSWNRSQKIGYRVMSVRIQNGNATDYQPFATGWLEGNNDVKGRPVDVEVAPDGALLVSDDQKGLIYRISKG